MMNNNEWVGVDLDGSLAFYEGWQGADHIGDPIPAMKERVLQWLSEGRKVKILTARVSSYNVHRQTSRLAIRKWCLKHFGVEIETTSEKDFSMIELWDDRCVQLVPNTGITVQEQLINVITEQGEEIEKLKNQLKEAREQGSKRLGRKDSSR